MIRESWAGQMDNEPTTYMVTYGCWNRDSRKSCDEMWQNETDSPRAWGYCPSCGKRRQAVSSRVAGSDSPDDYRF